MLLATAEQALFDLVAEGLGAEVALGDDPVSDAGATSSSTRVRRRIYGGSAEIQRNIIARRLLALGDDR